MVETGSRVAGCRAVLSFSLPPLQEAGCCCCLPAFPHCLPCLLPCRLFFTVGRSEKIEKTQKRERRQRSHPREVPLPFCHCHLGEGRKHIYGAYMRGSAGGKHRQVSEEHATPVPFSGGLPFPPMRAYIIQSGIICSIHRRLGTDIALDTYKDGGKAGNFWS